MFEAAAYEKSTRPPKVNVQMHQNIKRTGRFRSPTSPITPARRRLGTKYRIGHKQVSNSEPSKGRRRINAIRERQRTRRAARLQAIANLAASNAEEAMFNNGTGVYATHIFENPIHAQPLVNNGHHGQPINNNGDYAQYMVNNDYAQHMNNNDYAQHMNNNGYQQEYSAVPTSQFTFVSQPMPPMQPHRVGLVHHTTKAIRSERMHVSTIGRRPNPRAPKEPQTISEILAFARRAHADREREQRFKDQREAFIREHTTAPPEAHEDAAVAAPIDNSPEQEPEVMVNRQVSALQIDFGPVDEHEEERVDGLLPAFELQPAPRQRRGSSASIVDNLDRRFSIISNPPEYVAPVLPGYVNDAPLPPTFDQIGACETIVTGIMDAEEQAAWDRQRAEEAAALDERATVIAADRAEMDRNRRLGARFRQQYTAYAEPVQDNTIDGIEHGLGHIHVNDREEDRRSVASDEGYDMPGRFMARADSVEYSDQPVRGHVDPANIAAYMEAQRNVYARYNYYPGTDAEQGPDPAHDGLLLRGFSELQRAEFEAGPAAWAGQGERANAGAEQAGEAAANAGSGFLGSLWRRFWGGGSQ